MQLPSFVYRKPAFDGGMAMRRIIIDDDMDSEFLRDVLLDVFQEAEILLMAMFRFTLGDHSAVDDIQRSKQCCRTVSNVIMGHAFNVSQSYRQHGLRSI